MSDLTFTAGDTAPTIYGTLTLADGTAMDLTTASGVKFQMRPLGSGAYVVDDDATVVTAAAGEVKYDWAVGALDDPGDYAMRWQITWGDGTIQHSDPENTITVADA